MDDIKFGAGDKVGRGGVLILVDDIRFGSITGDMVVWGFPRSRISVPILQNSMSYVLSKFQVVQITPPLLTLCEKHEKCRKNDLSLKNRDLVPTIQPYPDFS